MKFGKVLAANSLPGWIYINYKGLKKIISILLLEKKGDVDQEEPSAWFQNTLVADIEEVEEFFQCVRNRITSREHQLMHQDTRFEQLKKLHKYAIINYLAVLKIVKKYDKHFTSIRERIVNKMVKMSFYKAVKSPSLFEGLKQKLEATDVRDCPICLEPCLTPVSLTCSHEFCWMCLWKGDSESLIRCPLCRKSQTLNPAEMNINDILGGFSNKYFPRVVEGKDPVIKPCYHPAVMRKPTPPLEKTFNKLVLNSSTAENKSNLSKSEDPSQLPKQPHVFNTMVGSLSHIREGVNRDFSKSLETETETQLPSIHSARFRRAATCPNSMDSLNEPEFDDGCIFVLEL
ncbi:hypothetical protein AAMO2058_001623000 [Amorphochlora amoebiformis]|eukprot:1107029-Amorphochlora_amoeboformis.AAC.2